MVPVAASAQAPGGPNQGAIRFRGGIDVPTTYLSRGILQEGDPKITLWPYGDLTFVMANGGTHEVQISVGVWNSLHTGTSGTGGPTHKLHYEEDFFASGSIGIAKDLIAQAGFIAWSSPNGSFRTIKEIELQIRHDDRYAPYAIVAFELSDKGQRDEGSKKGTYFELGGAPHWELPFGHVVISAPVKAGFSLKDYYELLGPTLTFEDHSFGFFEVGGQVTVPLSSGASRFGAWNIHGGVSLLQLGTTTEAFNKGDKTKIVALGGIGFTY